MNSGVDGEISLFLFSKKDRSGQQQSQTSETMVLYCLKKIPWKINIGCENLFKRIQTIKEWSGGWHCTLLRWK